MKNKKDHIQKINIDNPATSNSGFCDIGLRINLLPDENKFINPFNHKGWLDYFARLRPRFQYIRFLGLPSLKEQADVLLEQLYVPIYLGLNYASATKLEKKDSLSIEDALTKLRLLVILGDPGSGKSTVVNYLTTLFASRRQHLLSDALGHLIPLPFVLRDFSIDKNISFENLLRQFQTQPFWPKEALTENDLHTVLENGQALILLDGLDEIGDVKKRKALRKTIFEQGISKYPTCIWIFTSRTIGYEDVPFDDFSKIDDIKPDIQNIPSISTLQLLPFNNDQVKRFLQNWYALREADPGIRDENIQSLLSAISSSPSIEKLAHNPNLLTIIALIYRVYAKLPSGRVLLYDKITEAYLESIDEFRGIQKTSVPMQKHILWLSHLAYDMQCKRENNNSESREILVPVKTILENMRKYLSQSDNLEQELEYIARRSGLLLPKKPGYYNFVHLSFQEYFAALRLYECLMSFDHRDDTIEKIKSLKDNLIWHECLIFLFEKLSQHENASNWLFEKLFGGNQTNELPAAQLVACLLGDFQSGLNNRNKTKICQIILEQISEQYNSDLQKNIDDLPGEIFQDNFWPAAKDFIKKASQESKNITPDLLVFLQNINRIDFHVLESFLVETVLKRLETEQLFSLTPLITNGGPVRDELLRRLPLHQWFKSFSYLFYFNSPYLLLKNPDVTLNLNTRQDIIIWICFINQFLNAISIKCFIFSILLNKKNLALARDRALVRDLSHDRTLFQSLSLSLALDRAMVRVQASTRDLTRAKALDLSEVLDRARVKVRARRLDLDLNLDVDRARAQEWDLVQARDLSQVLARARDLDLNNNTPDSFFFHVIHCWLDGIDNETPQLPEKRMSSALSPMYGILNHLSRLVLGAGTPDDWKIILKHVAVITDPQWIYNNLPFVEPEEMKKILELIGLSLEKEKALFEAEWFEKGHPLAAALNAKPSEFINALNKLKSS